MADEGYQQPEKQRAREAAFTHAVAALTSDLEAGKGTAGKLLKDETLYTNANHMLGETQALIKAIRQDPKKYLSIRLHVF